MTVPSRARWLAAAAVVAAIVLVGFLALRPPPVPASAGDTTRARTVTSGPIDPDVDPEGEPAEGPMSPGGGECLSRISEGNGFADLCWSVNRDPADADPAKDYYLLHVYGSFESLRWLVVRADLVGEPAGNVYDTWPVGTFQGACREEPVDLFGPGSEAPELVCGQTVGTMDEAGWVQTVTWTCELCLLPDGTTKGFALYGFVGVPAGTVPEWDIGADAGA